MRRGLPGTRPRWGAPLDRDAARALSVRNVADIGGTGRAGMDAETGRLQRGVGMNNKQTVSREEYHSLDNKSCSSTGPAGHHWRGAEPVSGQSQPPHHAGVLRPPCWPPPYRGGAHAGGHRPERHHPLRRQRPHSLYRSR